jgi:hypothetical protein
MIVQVLLILISILFLLKAISGRGTHSMNAWKKIAISMLVVLMIVAVLLPDTTTQLANIVGVGRGADLVLYSLFAAFIFYVLNQYLKDQDQRDSLFRLARKLALLDANERYKDKL